MHYRKLPVTVEAVRFDGTNFEEIWAWSNPRDSITEAPVTIAGAGEDMTRLTVYTPNGPVEMGVGSWVVKGVEGEFYPCSDAIFQRTYEPVVGVGSRVSTA